MDIFSKPKEKNELMLVLNIGSSSVGGALFVAKNSGIPQIIFSITEPLRIEEKIEAGKFLSLTIKSLDRILDKIYKAGLGAPKQIFCVLSSPWYVSQTRIINFKKNTAFVFTEKLADELIEKEIKLFKEEYSIKYSNKDEAIRPIELKNIKTMLNGYEISNPIGQKTKEIDMIIFISMSGEKMLKKIEDTINKYFHSNMIKFSSFAIASFIVVRDIFAKQDNFLLVDIGGEITEIFMTKKNILRESISYPLGKNFLTRGVASNLGCTFDEAVSLLSLLKDGHAEETVVKKLKSATAALKEEWLKNFQISLANLSKDISIPATIYIIVDKDMIEFFGEIIKSEQFSQYTLTESKFEVIFIGLELLHKAAEFKDGATREPFTIIDSVYINRFLMKM